jgi:hypothetical protein
VTDKVLAIKDCVTARGSCRVKRSDHRI